MRVLHVCHNECLYKVRLHSVVDIADLVRDDHLEALTSSDRSLDFWISPSTRPFHRRVNRTATGLLLSVTGFTARNVPFLCGDVVVASHDSAGELAGLSEAQFERLINTELAAREEWTLGRRFAADERQRRREAQAVSKRKFSSSL